MMKAEVTKLMVEAVYQSLSSQEQEFIVMKYKNKKQMVAISLVLNLSLAQLHIRHHAILEKISEYMLYKLSEEDLFNREKIVNMIKLLERIIAFAEQYDPKKEFISVNWLEAIIERHDRYSQLLSKINEIMSEESFRVDIITAKMQNPYEKLDVLAEQCNLDKSGISRYLKSFVDDLKKYLE